MATSLLLSPLSSSSTENRELCSAAGLRNSSFVHNTKQIFSPPPTSRTNRLRPWRFRSPVAAKNQFDYIPKQFREENLKDGLMDNFKNVPQSLFGLTPSQLNMFMSEDNPISRQSQTVTEETISAAYNYVNNGGMYTVSSKDESLPPRYGMSMSANLQGRGYGRPRTQPPDLPSLLLDSRIIYLGMAIVPAVTELIVAQFLWLDYDSDKPIYLYINSPGTHDDDTNEVVGSDTDAYCIADMIHGVRTKVYTVNVAHAFGQAGMLLSLGLKGYRALQPHCMTKLYMPSVGRSSGPSIDMYIKAKELGTTSDAYLDLLVEGIGKPKDVIAKDISRGMYLGAQAAIDYGVADRIVYSLEEFEKKDHKALVAESKAMRKGAGQMPSARPANSPW